MKMKKVVALLCGSMMACSSVGFATIPTEKIGIGKVVPGMTVADLQNAYGQPNQKIGDNWYYSNFKVEVDKKDMPQYVNEVESRNTSLGTPGGVTIGQDASVLNYAYGPADVVRTDNGVDEYHYFNGNYSKKMKFTVLNQVIVKISCETID